MAQVIQPDLRYIIEQTMLADGRVIVVWADGHRSEFHAVWLRHSHFFPGGDRPPGPEGRFALSVDSGPTPDALALTDGGDVRITWQPGNIDSVFEARWLRDHCYSVTERARRQRPALTWGREIARTLPEAEWPEVLTSDSARLRLFRQVLDRGFALVRDVPAMPGEIANASNLFGAAALSPYADDPGAPTVVDVRLNPAVPVATRKADFLAPHTDTCWRQTLSGLLLMHCLKAHPDGGRSLLVDGFTVATHLRSRDPGAFELLSRVPLGFGATVEDRDDWRALGRVISCDARGEVNGIRYNGNSVKPLDLPDDLIEPAYRALGSFEGILHDRELWLELHLQPGDMLVLDNQRVLHGRTAFDPGTAERHLQTCAVERDYFHNRYRRLVRALENSGCPEQLSWGVI